MNAIAKGVKGVVNVIGGAFVLAALSIAIVAVWALPIVFVVAVAGLTLKWLGIV